MLLIVLNLLNQYKIIASSRDLLFASILKMTLTVTIANVCYWFDISDRTC
ncbi:MAG: hypothetical protein V7K68_02815 [Nostoc sp.]